MASNIYFYCRIHTYQLEKPEKETKPNTVRNNLKQKYIKWHMMWREKNKEDEHPDKKHRKWVIFTYFGEGTTSWQNCLRILIEEYLAKLTILLTKYCCRRIPKIRINRVKGESINTFALIVRWKTPEKLKIILKKSTVNIFSLINTVT
jgi:hypothetical protein